MESDLIFFSLLSCLFIFITSHVCFCVNLDVSFGFYACRHSSAPLCQAGLCGSRTSGQDIHLEGTLRIAIEAKHPRELATMRGSKEGSDVELFSTFPSLKLKFC